MRHNMKKIFAATAMLLVSAVLMGTATFAWFAMNTKSVADGLQVEAYSDSLYLEISTTNIDSDFAINTSFTENNVGVLRLATHKFLKDSTIVTLGADIVNDGSR